MVFSGDVAKKCRHHFSPIYEWRMKVHTYIGMYVITDVNRIAQEIGGSFLLCGYINVVANNETMNSINIVL